MSGNNKFTFGNFVWWTGEVVDINDPLQAGRVKVRIVGYHADESSIQTSNLPWAIVASPTTSASTGGIGNTPHALIVGAKVGGHFLDGESAQLPLVLYTYPGMTDGVPDVNKYARQSTVQKTLDTNSQWSEKASGASPTYPNNKVIETTSGHVIEIDDTPGKERIHVMHKSGTFYEFHSDGTLVSHVKGDEYKIVQKGYFVHIVGNANMVVDGNVTETISGNKQSNITGTYKINCRSYSINTTTSWTATVGSSGYMKCGGTLTQKAATIFLN